MKKAEKKIAKVMREYKKGKLPIGKSKKPVKSRIGRASCRERV